MLRVRLSIRYTRRTQPRGARIMDRFMSTADTNGTKEAANAGDPTLSRPGMNGDEFRKAAHAAIEDGRPVLHPCQDL